MGATTTFILVGVALWVSASVVLFSGEGQREGSGISPPRRRSDSEHPPTFRHPLVRGEKDHLAALVGDAEDQDLALEARDPLRGEIDDGHDRFAEKTLRFVVGGELGARPPLSYLRSEVHGELGGGLSRLRERLGGDDLADPYVHLLEVFPAYLAHDAPLRPSSELPTAQSTAAIAPRGTIMLPFTGTARATPREEAA